MWTTPSYVRFVCVKRSNFNLVCRTQTAIIMKTQQPSSSSAERQDAMIVSSAFLHVAFGGTPTVYSLSLGQPCTSVVVVHLLLPNDSSVRLSSDRLCFTPDNFCKPQLVCVEALENHTQWSVISHRLFSLDRNYDRAETPNVVVQTEATPLECPLLTYGGLMTKRKSAAMGSTQSTRLDLRSALPEETANETAEGATAADASWCVSHLASGYHFSVAAVVQPKGTTLLSWGLNTNGELGNSNMTSSPMPQQVITLSMQLQREPLTVAHVSCGKHHVAVITGQAKLFTWGCNKYGQLGLGDFSPRTQPEEVHFALATLSSHRRALRVMHTVQRGGNNVTHVACGSAHTLFVTHQQQILGMGYNQAGQLGLGHCLQQHKGWRSCTPIAVESLRDQSILDLAAGQNHSACTLSNGDVYTWGCGDDGRLGHGKMGDGVANPTLIKVLRDVFVRARAVRCGARHMAVISDSDLLYMWGANDFGQLGSKDNKSRFRPFLLATPALFAEGVEDVALGEFHTTCVTSAGKAYTWGLNLRDNSSLVGSIVSPQMIDLPEKERVRKISCGWTHTNIVTHINADDTSGSGQGTTFDRKIERERMNQRKAELARWRSFVATTMTSTFHEMKPNCSRDQEHAQIEKFVSDSRVLPSKSATQSKSTATTTRNTVEQIELILETKISLEQLAVSFARQAMQDAERHVNQVLRVARRNFIRNDRSKQDNKNNMERQSEQVRGIFYQNQLRPPELPAATAFSPPSMPSGRTFWSTSVKTPISPDVHPVAACTPFHPTPPPHSTLTAIVSKTSKLDQVRSPKRSGFGVPVTDSRFTSDDIPKYSTRPTGVKRITTRSPRSQIAVVEALLHQPSYSITQGVLTSARSRPQSK